ncbi:hypothetical protein ES705_33696 [subsurface metagenome]
MERNLDDYIKCLKNKIEEYKGIRENQGKMMEVIKPTIPLEAINYMSTVYKLMALEMVLDDLKEIITHQKETEREEDNSIESCWKSW